MTNSKLIKCEHLQNEGLELVRIFSSIIIKTKKK